MKKPLIGIIGGKGKMGHWFKLFFQEQGLDVIIADQGTTLSNQELAEKADIVIISVPIRLTESVIKEVRNYVRPESLLADFTSIKSNPIKEMKKAKSGVLGMHPLFGPLQTDFKKTNIVFCRVRDNNWVIFLKKLFQRNGAKIIEISPKEHDQQVAFLQALLHFTNINLGYFLSVKKFKSIPYFLTPAFKLQSCVLARVLSQNPKLYAEIEMFNPYFEKISQGYIKEIKKFQEIVKKKDTKAFEKKFNKAYSYLADYLKVGESKSNEILKVIDQQPVRLGKIQNISIKKESIGFLGPEGTFSWAGAKKTFSEKTNLIPFPVINNIFEAVNNEEVDLGLVPIQNTIGGLVSETIYALINYPIFVNGSFKIAINHCLVSKAKKLNQIKIIRSHPQALAQCKKWLDQNLPNRVLEPTTSTVAPILEDTSEQIGFIGPSLSAERFNLNILAKNIQDNKENFTRFFIISRKIEKQLINLKPQNTLLFLAIYDRVGVLRDILDIFAKNNINLSSLHSIPTASAPWDYLFFLELEKSYFDQDFHQITKELEKHCSFIRVIGTA